MLQPRQVAPGFERHEEVFLARYARLRAWALQLVENDRERAEDIVHDAYIQFTFTRPDLDAISNLDGYLYTMLRNLHLSQVRRATRLQHRSLSIVDYESLAIGLRTIDPRKQILLQDQLRQICEYACARRETSKAGIVLILRFFHGYYPGEIAQVMRSTREAVEERLRLARREAKQYIADPKSLRFINDTRPRHGKADTKLNQPAGDGILYELRKTIFDSRIGGCLERAELEALYRDDDASRLDHLTLSHLVSCPQCLDEVNSLLDLPSLSERFPTDLLGTDTRSKGGGDGGDGGGAPGGPTQSELRRCRKRAADVFEHRPAELCISVNGHVMAAQKVGSKVNEQTLTINVREKVEFVEILSEQDVRLLLVSVEDPPPHGAHTRSTRVDLSDDRMLEATLDFSNPWPTLHVSYSDPLMSEAPQRSVSTESALLQATVPARTSGEIASEGDVRSPKAGPQGALLNLWRKFANRDLWLRPGTITAVVALVVITAILFTQLRVPSVTAAQLLERSAVADEALTNNPNVVTHRTINLEERKADGGALISKHRIEVWRSAAHGVRLRRIYDEQNNLLGGEWTRSDGTSIVYRRGTQPQTRTAPELAAGAILETGEFWRLDASARSFTLLMGRPDAITVEEQPNTYVLGYQRDPARKGKLLRASLTLNKADLHAIGQILVVERDGETRELRFIETGLEQKEPTKVRPEVFQPEPELLGPSTRLNDSVDKTSQAADNELPLSSSGVQPSSAVASPELEIEVAYLLNRIKADLGEQVSMTRTTGGILHVEALVESTARKEEILRALSPLLHNPAVKINVRTVAEAVETQQRQSKPRDATSVREVEIANNRIPADAELRAYFSARLVGDAAIEQEIDRYAGRAMNRSRQALVRASALKGLVRRFSPEAVRSLAPEAQAKWLAMIREHALVYRREIAALRQELRPVFGGPTENGSTPVTESKVAEAADRLLQLSYANDEAVRSAFTISSEGRTAAAIKSWQFWRSLNNAEKLAEAIEKLY